jgi:hypothetical protein
MKLRDHIQNRFLQLGTAYLQATPEQAQILASTIADAHPIHAAFCQFCQAPSALSQSTAASILRRWAALAEPMLAVTPMLTPKIITPAVVPSMGVCLESIYDTATNIGISLELHAAAATEFANCISKAASPTFAFYQRCLSPKDHTLEVLASSLKALIEGAMPYAAASATLLGAGAAMRK